MADTDADAAKDTDADNDTTLPLLDDTPSATPLDLLLNAISGTDQYSLLADQPASSAAGEAGERFRETGEKRKRALEDSPRQTKIAKTLSSHFTDASVLAQNGRTFSTVEVWHPKTGQKSYPKERRILNPPPILRVTGPLLPALTNVTLSVHPVSDERPILSHQTHRFVGGEESDSPFYPGSAKRYARDEKKRQMRDAAKKTGWGGTLPWERNRDELRERSQLEEGITFPGLWIGEEAGKCKEFALELSVGQPGDSLASEPIDEAALRNVLSATEMAPLINLSEAEAAPIDMDDKAEAAIDPSLKKTQPQQVQAEESAAQPWATFTSDSLSIVSKPSQKTAKARSLASCLSEKDAFALFVRVNGQTVRTKYLNLDTNGPSPQLAARTGKWSPFGFEVVQRAVPQKPEDKDQRSRFKLDADREASVVTYGSVVRLVDLQTDTRSDPMRLVRVDKNTVVVGADEGRPVSDLQRVGFVRMVDGVDDMSGGGRWYLSAPGAVAGAEVVRTSRARPKAKTPVSEPSAMPETLGGVDDSAIVQPVVMTAKDKSRQKTKRYALARVAIEEEQEGSSLAGLVWMRVERKEGDHVFTEGKVSTTRQATIETVADWKCWMLTGVSSFSYSFFNGLGEAGSLPTASLDPVPRLLAPPVLRLDHSTLDLTLSHFYVTDTSGQSHPFSVYLGPIGPLKTTTWRSVAPPEKYYDQGTEYPAVPYSGNADEHAHVAEERRVYSNFSYRVNHVIAMVELPEMDEIRRVMRECANSEAPPPAAARPESGATHGEGEDWLGVIGAEELTIQEALRNAGKNGDMHKDEFSLEQLPTHLIDPELETDAAGLESGRGGLTMHAGGTTSSSPATLSLPVLLVRQDGVGFGAGCRIEGFDSGGSSRIDSGASSRIDSGGSPGKEWLTL